MDEEELEQPSSKINVGSFFERVDSVDRVANRALSRANANLGIINNQQLIIQSLSVSIEAMETKIRDIANYIIIEKKAEKDAEEDRRLEEEDREQKNKMLERAMGLKGEPGPKGDPGKPAEQQQGGGGSFLGGLLKGLATLGITAFTLKYIGPVLLPKLLLLAKTKLIPIIGTALKGAFTKLASLLGATLKGLVAKIPVVGKALAGGGLIGGISAGIAKIGSFISNALSGKGGGQTSDSNLKVDSSPVNEMFDTLEKSDLVEGESFSEYRNRIGNVESEEPKEEEKKFKVTTGKKDKSVEDLERDYAAALAEVQKRKDEGANQRKISFANQRASSVKYVLDMKKADMGLGSKEDAAIGKMLKEAGMGEGKSSYSATTEYKIVEPIKQDRNLSLLDATNNRVDNIIRSTTDEGNKDQNQGVVTPLNTSQTANANIENTTSDVNFVRFNKNQFIASQHRNLPPEVLRRLT